jgi:hypothetical protein
MRSLKRGTEGYYVPGMKCSVLGISYDFALRTGDIHFPGGCCCDMQGCVAFFLSIDPEVRLIRTWSGDRRDTAYSSGLSGRRSWTALTSSGYCGRKPSEGEFWFPPGSAGYR